MNKLKFAGGVRSDVINLGTRTRRAALFLVISLCALFGGTEAWADTVTDDTETDSTPIATFEIPSGEAIGKNEKWCADKNKDLVITADQSLKSTNEDYAKLSKGDAFTMTIPEGVTVTSIVMEGQSNSSSNAVDITISGDNITSQSMQFQDSKSFYQQKVSFSPGISGQKDLIFTNTSSSRNLRFHWIKVYGEDKSGDIKSTATFTYEGSQLSFEKSTDEENTYVATITTTTLNKEITLNITKDADGATIKEGETEITESSVTFNAPSTTGGTVTKTYTVTSVDKSNTTKYIINVIAKRQSIALKFVDKNDEDYLAYEQNVNTEPNKKFESPTLKAFLVGDDGVVTDTEINLMNDSQFKDKFKYSSEDESLVYFDDSHVLHITDNAHGSTRVHVVFNGNDNYEPDSTYFDVSITQGYERKAKNQSEIVMNTPYYITKDDTGENSEDKEKLLMITFGGWKYNNGTYTPASESSTDTWKKGDTDSNVSALDGFQYGISGVNDAMNEAMDQDVTKYGSARTGWFKSPRSNWDKPENIPFTLPVRGTYMTFDPLKNGTLTVYIIQNGAWNTNSSGEIKRGDFRPHAFFITNQRGELVQDFDKTFELGKNAITKQVVDSRFSCDLNTLGNAADKESYNVADWAEFKNNLSSEEQQAIAAAWKAGTGGTQNMVEMDDGSFLAIQKTIAKYTFHVTANETYYLFSNFSKMGFCGANFVEDDEQPGESNVLELSETTAYDAPTTIDKNAFEVTVGSKSVPQFATVKVDRSFTAGQWNTITLPFNMTEKEVKDKFGEGTQLILLNNSTLNAAGNAELEFIYHEIQGILAGYPYLIKPLNDVNGFSVNNKCIDPDIEQCDIECGAYTAKGIEGYSTARVSNGTASGYSINYAKGDIFVSNGNGKLYASEGNSYGKGYRSYLKKNDAAAEVKGITMSYSGVDDGGTSTPTAIEFAELAPEAAETLGFAGVYNLNGQKVAEKAENLPAGVYIVNGNKIVVK